MSVAKPDTGPGPSVNNQNASRITSRSLPNHHMMEVEWLFFKQSYNGGKAYITSSNLHRYHKEGPEEYNDRLSRAYRENHSKRVVDLINTYLFKETAARESKDQFLLEFWANIDGKGTDIKRFMKDVSMWASVFGRVYVICDKKPLPLEERTGTHRDNLNPKARPYCYMVEPQNVMDIAYSKDDQKILWAIVRETYRDEEDPFTSSGDTKTQYRLWERGQWTLFNEAGEQIDFGETGLSIVPIVSVDNESKDQYNGQSLIGDIAYIDRAIFNDWSRLDVIINDQTFSQLIFPIEGLPAEVIEDAELRAKYMALGTKRVVLYSASAMKEPMYISPDAEQASFILEKIEKQIRQLYANMGLQAETATETSDRKSGVAKAYDFDKLNKLMKSKADNLEIAEEQIVKIFFEWMNISKYEYRVDYPNEFDVKTLAYEIQIAQDLAILGMPATFMKEIKKSIALKAMNRPSPDTIKKVTEEIDNMSEDDATLLKSKAFDFDNQSGGDNTDDSKGGKASA